MQADAGRWLSLTDSLISYKNDPFREKMLFLREMAHQSMRQLLAPDRLETLTLTEFNHHVWQLGAVTYQGQRARIDSPDIVGLLGQRPMSEVQAAYAAGELVLTGNQTWGSATGVYGAQLRLDDGDKLALLRGTLRDLLYGPGDDGERLARVLAASNGFGMNIATGLLHVIYPAQHILYNSRSIEMLTEFAVPGKDYFLLALLNSRLLFKSIQEKAAVLGDTDRGGRMRFKAVYVEQLPIRQIDLVTSSRNRETAVTQAKSLYEKGNHPSVLAWVAAELAANCNDTIHDLLAFLAQEMIRLHQEKQTETTAFLSWLADYTGLPVDNWSLKTIAQSYHEAGWEEFKRALGRNVRAIQQVSGVDVQGREALGRIKREYEQSMSVLTPLLARIQATDALIDQIVYKLYGLTEEQIAIVEGRGCRGQSPLAQKGEPHEQLET